MTAASLWDKDKGIQNLGTLGGTCSTAHGINNSGQVVGQSEKSNGPVVGYLWEDDVMQDLNDLIDPASGWDLIDARPVNDAGQILGYGARAGTGGELFLLTPVAPVRLPAVVWLMLSALASLGWLKHRRAAAC
jgi:probable HAF family extracellular repeat protein